MDQSVNIIERTILSKDTYELSRVTFSLDHDKGATQSREVFDRGNGAAILLYNEAQQTVVLTRQFRLPTYLNGNKSGKLIEVCAGLLDGDNPEDCIIREAEEETGYRPKAVTKAFEVYMSPGAVTEILYCFTARYDASMKIAKGGGLAEEHEYIDVLEMPFAQACNMIATGEIRDAKTIMLLQYAQINKLLGS